MVLKTIHDLHDYEKRAVAAAIRLKYAGIFMGTGLGKTIVALTIIDQLLKRKAIRSTLVVGTKKAIYNTWRQEAQDWEHTQRLTFSIIHGNVRRGQSDRVKRQQLFTPADVYLINYEGLPWLAKILRQYAHRKFPFSCIFYDESTKMKHSTTQRFKQFKPFMDHFEYRYPMTGTPAPNGVQDLYGQIYVMDLGMSLGTTLTSFRSRFFTRINRNSYNLYVPMRGATAAIRKRIASNVIYMKKEDYLSLPPIYPNAIRIDLPEKLRDQYEELEEKFFIELDNAKVESFSQTSLSMKLRQFLQGNVYQGDGKFRRTIAIHREKLEVLKEMVDLKQKETRILEGIGNAIIAYNFQFEREDLKSIFPNAPSIDGATTEKEAERYIKEWNLKYHPVLLYNPASDPHGLNLQFGGNQLLWYSLTWNLEHYIQLIDRLHRQRQVKPVFVHHLLFRKTVDEVLYDVLIAKEKDQSTLLNALRLYRQTATSGNQKGG